MTEQKLTKNGRGRPKKSLNALRCGNCGDGKIYIVYGQRQVFCTLEEKWHSVFDTCDLERK